MTIYTGRIRLSQQELLSMLSRRCRQAATSSKYSDSQA
jgi:hypothetical protein